MASSVTGPVHNSMAASCERIERIDQLISGAGSLTSCNMCHLCAAEIARKVDSTFREVEGIRKTYQAALATSQSGTNTTEFTQKSAKALNIDKYLQTSDSEQIAAAIYDLEQDIALLEREERCLLTESRNRQNEARLQSANIAHLQTQIGDLEYEHSKVMERLPRVLQLLDTSAREINYLRHCFDRNNGTLIPATPLFDVAVEPSSRYGYMNGRRLAYKALSAQNLNWSEINCSWAVVGSFLQCTRSYHDLTECLDFSTAHCRDLAAHFGLAPPGTGTESECYSMKLRPLKDRVLLLLQVEPVVVADCTLLNSPNARQADSLNASSSSRSSISTVDTVNTPRNTTTAASLAEVATPFPTHINATNSPHGKVAITSPNARNNSNRAVPQVRQRTVHLEGGVQDAHTSGGTRTPSSKNTPSFGTIISNAEAEYRNAVLLLACAAVVTLLEVTKVKAPHTSPRASSGTSGAGGSDFSASGSEVNSKMEKMFVGHMLDLACVLLTCEGVCLEVPASVGNTAASATSGGSAGANVHGSVSEKSAASAGSRSPLPPGSPSSRPHSVPVPVARSMLRSVVRRSDAKQAETTHAAGVKMEKLHSYVTFCDIGGSEGCSLDVLSCSLVSAGLASSDAETLMETLVVDLLRTLVIAMGR